MTQKCPCGAGMQQAQHALASGAASHHQCLSHTWLVPHYYSAPTELCLIQTGVHSHPSAAAFHFQDSLQDKAIFVAGIFYFTWRSVPHHVAHI